ncbi:hypothetical protein FJZ41_01395 [Candidatus Shapirobacteria bacterium]|nr:hypothetical protein [Candidatus Shapirobacteria bacterium]
MKIKKITLLLVILLFAFWVLGVSVIKTLAVEGQSASQNYKVTAVDSMPVEEETNPEATMAASKEVDYFLAYPGILPDHFLYPVKMVRDRLWLWLTINPLKKGELMLLFADKRLGAGRALVEGNKIDLGLSTLTKGEKYLQQAVVQEDLAKGRGENTQAFLEKLSWASLKHEEVLLSLYQKVGEQNQTALQISLDLLSQAQDQIKKALGQ